MSSSISLECPVCLDPFTTSAVAGKCLHNLCECCYDLFGSNKKCPTCRDPIDEVNKNCQFLDAVALLNAKIIEYTTLLNTQTTPPPSIPLSSSSLNSSEINNELFKAIEKATTFLSTFWSSDSLRPADLTALDIDLLWDRAPDLCKSVLHKIYDRLSIFGTESCTAIEKNSIKIIKIRYKHLCFKAASRKAAAGSDAVAQYCLGHCLFNGIHCVPNYDEAFSYFQSASLQGLPLAIYSIGLAYEQGKGVEPNPIVAVKYYKDASQLNCVEALIALGKCYINGTGTQRNIPKGLSWYQAAADMGNIDALMFLGDFYSQKTTIPDEEIKQNIELATEYYTKALARGHTSAQKDVERCLTIQNPPAPQHPNGCALM